ncbi:hypothetical protein, partial [Klebsiella pneumoniae]
LADRTDRLIVAMLFFLKAAGPTEINTPSGSAAASVVVKTHFPYIPESFSQCLFVIHPFPQLRINFINIFITLH